MRYERLASRRLRAAVKQGRLTGEGTARALRIHRSALAAFLEGKAGGRSVDTSNHYLRAIRGFARWLRKRVKDNPQAPFVHLTNVVAAQGALPIKVGDDTIGAVGVSGAPGGEKDEVCAKAGIDKVADQLK